jgi:copper chaperone
MPRAMETEVEIEGMSCEHCVAAVKSALARVPGVKDARVTVGRAVLVSDAPVSRDAVANAVADEGYRVRD